mgnify:CR=1
MLLYPILFRLATLYFKSRGLLNSYSVLFLNLIFLTYEVEGVIFERYSSYYKSFTIFIIFQF